MRVAIYNCFIILNCKCKEYRSSYANDSRKLGKNYI